MRLTWGDTRRLTGDWAQVEMNTNDSSRPMQVEGVVVRAALWGRRFTAFELAVPVERVRPAGVELRVPSLFARCADLNELREMNTVWGKEGIVEDGLGSVLKVPGEFVDGLMEREGKRASIRLGAFVRILYGPERMLCGKVKRVNGRMAVVNVETRARVVTVTLPVTALESLRTEERDYFTRED